MEHGERFNTITHLAGALLAAAGAVGLLAKALASGDGWKVAASIGFGLSMLLLYTASTLYHGSCGARKALWARIDHCAIYVLIAGTYLPFALVTLRGPAGWALMAVVFALALLGISKELWWGRHAVPSVPLYLATGWIGVAALVPVTQRLDPGGLIGLLGGAVLYTTGVLFYYLGGRWRHAHGVWHLFVLGGTGSHYFTVLLFVV